MSRGVNPGVLAKFPIWPSNHHGHLIIPSLQLAHSSPLLSPVTIPQVVAANENLFSVNLPGKINVCQEKSHGWKMDTFTCVLNYS
jgi:hypothetical protein